MEMFIDITIEKIVAKIILPQGRKDNILAFGEIAIFLKDNQVPTFKARGFTIRQFLSKQSNTHFLKVSFPAYKAGVSFMTSFVIEDKELYKKIVDLLLGEYSQQVGDNRFRNEEPEVNPDDIPF